jgi:transposase
MSSYSKDLKLKVLAATDRGTPRREVVETFGVSLDTLKRWLKKRSEGEKWIFNGPGLLASTRRLIRSA